RCGRSTHSEDAMEGTGWLQRPSRFNAVSVCKKNAVPTAVRDLRSRPSPRHAVGRDTASRSTVNLPDDIRCPAYWRSIDTLPPPESGGAAFRPPDETHVRSNAHAD